MILEKLKNSEVCLLLRILLSLSWRTEHQDGARQKKYPEGTYKDLKKGRFDILPIYKADSESLSRALSLSLVLSLALLHTQLTLADKTVKEPQTLPQKPDPAVDPGALAAWERMKKRAEKVLCV